MLPSGNVESIYHHIMKTTYEQLMVILVQNRRFTKSQAWNSKFYIYEDEIIDLCYINREWVDHIHVTFFMVSKLRNWSQQLIGAMCINGWNWIKNDMMTIL